MAIRKLKSGHFQIDIKLKGHPRYRRVHREARNRADAKVIESRLLQRFFDRQWRPRYGEESFEGFCKDTYMAMARVEKKSWAFDKVFIKQAIPYFKGKNLIDITPEDIRNFRDKRAQDETRPGQLRARGTVRREVAMLARIFSYAVELEKLQVNPCRFVKVPMVENTRTRVISRAEEAQILEAIEREIPMLTPVVVLAMQTGMRRSEILSLQPRMVDLEVRRDLRGNVTQWGGINLPGEICKSGKGRYIALNEAAHMVLTALQGVEAHEQIFTLRPGYVSHLFTWACKGLGLMDATFHTLRHTWATRALEAGVPETVVQSQLGHATLKMTSRYLHPDQEMLHKAVQQMSDHRPAEVQSLGDFGAVKSTATGK